MDHRGYRGTQWIHVCQPRYLKFDPFESLNMISIKTRKTSQYWTLTGGAIDTNVRSQRKLSRFFILKTF